MTKEQFIGLLRSPSTINLNLISELEDVTSRFPYFQNAHLLLAKQYHGHENIRFESYLRKAAAYAPDRSVLYQLIRSEPGEVIHINGEKIPEPHDSSTENISSTVPVAETINIIEELHVVKDDERSLPDEPVVYAPAENISDNTLVPDSEPPEQPNESSVPDPRAVIEQRLRELRKDEKSDTEPVQKPSQNLNGIKPKQKSDRQFEETARKKDESETKRNSVPGLTPSHKAGTDEKPSTSKATSSKFVEPGEIKHSFSEWLKLKTVVIIPAGLPGTYFDSSTDNADDKSSVTKPQKEVDSLLDNFIKNEPRIVPARSEFYSPGNMARKSAVEHEDLISETLARIYAQQGNLRKAIEAYQRLSLKNPEKSSYFAALIKDLEEKENQK